MIKVKLEDGTEKEFPSDEELQALQKKAVEADTLKTELDTIKNNPTEKNWKALRDAKEKAQTALKEKGLEMGEDGTIKDIETQKQITPEQMGQIAYDKAMEVAITNRKTELLSKYKEEDKKVIEYFYNKFSTGETMDLSKVEKFINDAEVHLSPAPKNISPNINGQPPRFVGDAFGKKDNFAETDIGKQLAKDAFGDEAYSLEKK